MNEEVFSNSVRAFLKKVGITSQRALEAAVAEALESGRLKGDEHVNVKVQLSHELSDEVTEIEGTLKLS